MFSMQPGVLPANWYKWWVFLIWWGLSALLVFLLFRFLRGWPFFSPGYHSREGLMPPRLDGWISRDRASFLRNSIASAISIGAVEHDTSYRDDIELGSIRSTRDIIE